MSTKSTHEETHLMKDYSRPRTPAEYLRIYLTGFAMGAADIVPGVSGGTMAFILGVYETLLDAIKSVNIGALRLLLARRFGALFEHVPVRFLIPLGLGIATAILALSNLLGTLLADHPLFVFAFFAGLILASIVAVGVKIRWNAVAGVALVAGAVFAFWLVGLPALRDASHDPLTLFASGAVAICAMILPGISGSFILLILGQYEYVLGAVRQLDVVTVALVGAGAVVGILGFSRILSWLLKHYETPTIAALVGFMIGSLRTIWERSSEGATRYADFGAGHIAGALALVLLGFLIVSLMDHMQTRDNPVFRLFGRNGKIAAAAD